MSQAKLKPDNTQVSKPKGFMFVVGLCILWGFYGLIARLVFRLLPIGKNVSSQIPELSFAGIIQMLFDLGFLLGGVYIFKKQNWARLLILVIAVAKIFDWLYGAIVYRWLLSVLSLAVWSLPTLLMATVFTIYFSRPSVKAYMY